MTGPKRYELVFLDLDDTLLDFHAAEELALVETCREFGIVLDGAFRSAYGAINRELWGRLEKGEITIGELKRERFRLVFENDAGGIDHVSFNDSFLRWLSRGVYPLEGAAELCASLAERHRLVIISNGIRDVQLPRIGASPFAGLIERIVVSEEAGVGKPDRGIFEYSCDLVGCHDKAGMIMVGDSLASDVRGGFDFGIDTCWFNPGRRPNEGGLEPTFEAAALLDMLAFL